MKNIIVATDFTEASLNATLYAAALAQKIKAKLNIFHAYPKSPDDLPEFEKFYREVLLENQIKGNDVAAKIRDKYRINVELYFKPEPLLKELEKLVKETHALLVILGISGDNPLNRVMYGSTAISVLKSAGFAVLAVPEDAKFKEPKNILFACLPQLLEKDNKLGILKLLAKKFKSKIKIVKVTLPELAWPPQGEAEKHYLQLNEKLQHTDFHYVHIESDDFLKGIEEGIRAIKPDMLVMVPGKYTVWEAINRKSNTRRVAMNTHLPLLTIPE